LSIGNLEITSKEDLGGVTHSKLKRRRRRFGQNAGKQGGWEKTGERRLAKQKLQVPPTKSDPAQER